MEIIGQGEFTIDGRLYSLWISEVDHKDNLGFIVETPKSIQVYPLHEFAKGHLPEAIEIEDDISEPCVFCGPHAGRAAAIQAHDKDHVSFPLEGHNPSDSPTPHVEYTCNDCLNKLLDVAQTWVQDNPELVTVQSI